MRMSVKQLRAFLAVAHTLNFAHASERLNLSQPALSLTIKGLEEALGGALLQRSTRKVTLTQEGELFLPMARQLLADWDNVEEAMRQSFTLQRPSAVRLMLEEALARSGRQLDVALESHQLVTVGRMVASGLGGSAVPALCKTQMASLGAVCIPLSDPPIEKCVGAIHAGHLPLSKAAQALLDTLKGFLPT